MAAPEPEVEAKLHRFLQWLQANGGELRGSSIEYCGPNRGFGVFSNKPQEYGVAMVVPLDLAITPMRVLQDPTVGPRIRALFDEGDVDDRFLIMLFLMVEHLRPDSPWKPYLDMLPVSFGNPLWFTDSELDELKGTTLYRASVLQRKKLKALYEDKVKSLVEELLQCDGESKSLPEVRFEDFLWANSIFWTRALNIPLPHFYVYPELPGEEDNIHVCHYTDSDLPNSQRHAKAFADGKGKKDADIVTEKANAYGTSKANGSDTVWVEGLVPGIDFCNHSLKAAATWEVDQLGSVTGVSASMYLIVADQCTVEDGKEITISYGNKGNEELLYLYGFVIDKNQDDYLMVHYPMEAFQDAPFSDSKAKLLEMQNAELRCLLPRSLLDHGFFAGSPSQEDTKKNQDSRLCNYSWSGRRKVPSYINRLVFPQNFLTALRTIAMRENELKQVSLLLEELVGPGEARQPSDVEVQSAVWEVCGDYEALELLVDLLRVKIMELEEGSGVEASDDQLLENCQLVELEENISCSKTNKEALMTRNKWSSIVYRRGQKQLARLFLKEADHALDLYISEQQ